MSRDHATSTPDLLCNPKDFFQDSLSQAFEECHIQVDPLVHSYLVDVLTYYLLTEHLYEKDTESGRNRQDTLAEMLLRANGAGITERERFELLKKLGDSSLYISGFFGDSLQRKVVDVDYYINMGSTAYVSLSKGVSDNTFSQLYQQIAQRFDRFVEAFTVMSHRAMTHGEKNIMRLMDVYSRTGSKSAKQSLADLGIFTSDQYLKKCGDQ